MITHLRGKLVSRSPTWVEIDVGGVGYGLSISLTTYDQLPESDSDIHLFTFTYVREDRLDLYGFADRHERQMFEMLIGVSGIGPNLAQTVLSGMSVSDLKRAIVSERAAELTRVRGHRQEDGRQARCGVEGQAGRDTVGVECGSGSDRFRSVDCR